MSSSKPNRILLAIISAITLISIIVVIISFNKPVEVLDARSPEGVVQSYLTAIFDGNYERAVENLEMQSICEANDLDRTFVPQNVRIDLLDVVIEDSRARVKFQIEYPSGAPLDSYYTEEQVIRLINENNEWKITGIPWPMYDCGTLTK